MQEFKTYHPIVNFFYFACVTAFTCFYMHPVFTLTSLVCGIAYAVMTGKAASARLAFLVILPIIPVSAVLNSLFNHGGMTILGYFSDGNPLTAKSIVYGAASGTMIAAVISFFLSYNKIITSDKFIYIFGKAIPSLSLIFSMVINLIPRLAKKAKEISDGQRGLAPSKKSTLFSKLRASFRVMSILVTWSLEDAVDTADSMKSRGYGLSKRSAYSNFVFDKRDATVTVAMAFLLLYTFIGICSKGIDYVYFPSFKINGATPYAVSVFISYFLLCATPIIIESCEAIRWKFLRQKI